MSGCGDCLPWVFPAGSCGITDIWDRLDTTSPDWGIADAHIEWSESATGSAEVNISGGVGRLWVPEITTIPGSAIANAHLLDPRRAIRSDMTVTPYQWEAVVPPVDGGAIFTFIDHGFGFHIESSVSSIPVAAVHKLRLLAATPTTAQEEIAFAPTPGSPLVIRHEVEEGVEQRIFVNGGLLLTQDISAHTWTPSSAIGYTLSTSGSATAVPIPEFEVFVNDLDCTDTDGNPIAWCVPVLNQPVYDELVATGDGVTEAYSTAFSYLQGTLQVYVGTILSEVDETDPAAGQFTLIEPAPLGAAIRVSYRAGAS